MAVFSCEFGMCETTSAMNAKRSKMRKLAPWDDRVVDRPLGVVFLLMTFRQESTAQAVETRLGTDKLRSGAVEQVILRSGPILAIAARFGDDDPSPFEGMVAKLRERMGLDGK